MAPPTIAPPINPPTTAAPTPRCALAGVAASEAAIVATATKAANVFFMSWALLGLAPSGSAGLKVNLIRRIRNWPSRQKAHDGQSKVTCAGWWAEKAVFSGRERKASPKTAVSGDADLFVTKMNGLQPQTRTRRTRQP